VVLVYSTSHALRAEKDVPAGDRALWSERLQHTGGDQAGGEGGTAAGRGGAV